MITYRGWLFLLTVLVILVVGFLDRIVFFWRRGGNEFANVSLVFLGMSLGLWFAWEWLLFAVRARIMVRRLKIERVLFDERGPIDTLWARRAFQVRVIVRLSSWLRLPYVKLDDRLPYAAELGEGTPWYEGPVEVDRPGEWSYRLRCPAIGRLRFEGARLELADLQGFFYFSTFLAGAAEYRVLPSLADAEGHSSTIKRHNLLPPPGIHRLRRPGSGSELLDLRDYLPGDPPKTIAWKVSARRDRLITKKFESEVPVRCTLFVDTSNSARVGPRGHNALNQLVEIAAGVAQATAAARDLTGLCLFDDQETTIVRPARGARHLVRLINLLADAGGLTPSSGNAQVASVLPIAHAFAQQVYPQLLRPELNHVPVWLPWLFPQPIYTMRRPTLADRVYAWLPFFLAISILVGIGLGLLLSTLLMFAITRFEALLGALQAGNRTLIVVGIFVLLEYVYFATFFKVIAKFFLERRRNYRRRKQLSALLSVHYNLAPGGLALLLEDDDYFVGQTQRFLAEHQVPYEIPANEDGLHLDEPPSKISVLASALLRAVGRGHDNEMYVLLVDLLDIPERLEPLLRAVKVAVAHHHRVLVVCPWPADVPYPGKRRRELPVVAAPGEGKPRGDAARCQRAFQGLRRTFARFGVPVIAAQSGEPARMILERLDRLRLLGKSQGIR